MRVFLALYFAVSGLAIACITGPIAGEDIATGKWREFKIADQKIGSVVVFLSAKCPCSRSHEPELKALATEYPGFQFIGIHSNQDEEDTLYRDYLKGREFSFPVLRDKRMTMADAFKALKTPHAFVVGKGGECLYQGGVDDSRMADKAQKKYLREALAAVQQGKKPEVSEARTLGCMILR